MRIGSREIGSRHEPLIIAEIGVNHDGSLDKAMGLVSIAADAGADAVKFQYFVAEQLLTATSRPAVYQRNAGLTDLFTMLQSLQLSLDAMRRLADHAHCLGLVAIVTVFSLEHVDDAASIDWEAFKTASPDIINRPLVERLCADGRPLIMSTGAATEPEIARAMTWTHDTPCALMQCVSAYPAPDDCANLAAIQALARHCKVVGYSDHTTSIETGALAVAAGAAILEKHLTSDRSSPGPDHAMSLAPADFAQYVTLARRAHAMMGTGEKAPLTIERDVRDISRQSIVTRRFLPAGHTITRQDLTIKRPGNGIAPYRLDEMFGRRLARSLQRDTPLTDDDLQPMPPARTACMLSQCDHVERSGTIE